MPATARDSLALRLRQNWMSKYPLDTCGNGGLNLDDSLTSLNWLQNLNIMKITSVAPPPSISPAPSFPSFQDTNNNKNLKVNPNAVLNVACAPPPCKMEPKLPLMDTPPLTPTTLGGESIDYKTNPYVKPPYSYATLICMAMKETKKTKITLSSIYNWITDNFMYYRLADPSWQNSIRHNLSLNKCFQKVPRRKDEPGKGGFWRINPEYSDMIENGIFKKRRNSRDACLPPNAKRVKKEDDDSQGALSDHFLFNTSGSHKRSSQHSQRGGDLLNLSHEAESLKGDFNWQSILNQDIEIGGVRVKTEYLIDTADPSLDSPSGAMSPPSSDSDDNFSIEDLLSTDLSNSETPIDFTTDNPLDLTLTGQQIRAPEWWDGSLGGMKIKTEPQSGLHTPIHVADHVDTDHAPHPWAEHDGLADIGHAFDVDNLFDIDNIPSPRLL